MDEQSLSEKINSGYYDVPGYPKKPEVPRLLKKKVFELTKKDIEVLDQVKKDYESDSNKFLEQLDAYNKKQRAKMQEFVQDVFEELMWDDSEFANALYGIAWERGHSCGLHEVLNCMYNLDPLWDIHQKELKAAKNSK